MLTAGHLLKVLLITESGTPAWNLESGYAKQAGSPSSNKVAAFYLFRLALGASHPRKCQSNRITHHKPASMGTQGQREGILLCKIPTLYSTISKEIPYRNNLLFSSPSLWQPTTLWVAQSGPAVALDTQTQMHFLPIHTSFPLVKGAAQKPDGELRPHQLNLSSGWLGWLLPISEQGAPQGLTLTTSRAACLAREHLLLTWDPPCEVQ